MHTPDRITAQLITDPARIRRQTRRATAAAADRASHLAGLAHGLLLAAILLCLYTVAK